MRGAFLVAVRLPLTLVEGALGILLDLPRAPHLGTELARLRTQLTRRQLEVIQLREALRHLIQATQLQQVGEETEGSVVRIIGRTILPTQHVVLLDRGSREGIAEESVLVDVAGVVGRVLEVHPMTSLGLLLTDPNSRIACLIERSREGALLVGTGTLHCRLDYLDPEADVEAGDRVVSAGLGGPFPKGLLLGLVTKVRQDERNARVIAWVRPAVRVSQLEEVLCLPPTEAGTPPTGGVADGSPESGARGTKEKKP